MQAELLPHPQQDGKEDALGGFPSQSFKGAFQISAPLTEIHSVASEQLNQCKENFAPISALLHLQET